ncbi:MAG: serine/threonine protein kinase [Planctomycetaceae bacterium]|nr:serine/threonine protein kinase [Planctomycetaceae bacterium]
MPNDREAAELVSRSLSGFLNPEESIRLENATERSEQMRVFAKLSGLIQSSVQRMSVGDPGSGTEEGLRLPDDARVRLRKSIHLEQLRRSQASSGFSSTIGMQGETLVTVDDAGDGQRTVSSRFTFIRKLGEGGLGTVWLARDENLKRLVALKEMNSEVAELPRAWQRFNREAQITGHLEHPSVVPLYQYGTDKSNGQPFYAMRFVGKRTLANAIDEYHQQLASGKDVSMDFHYLLAAFISVCQAIAYAHSRGVIHRDLKPENVALDNFGQVIVLDWGLARMASDVDGTVAATIPAATELTFGQTMAGEIVGTPLYMAPEQAAGDQDRVDERTDVYGLGAILFSILSGSPPHQNSSLQDGSPVPIQSLLKRISEDESPRPRLYRKDVPSGLEAICMRAMERFPHSRYSSAMELAEAVQRWIAGRSEHRKQYDNARSEGRELRTSLQSSVRDLERNVRFMASLPPVQEIITALGNEQQEEQQSWRERLSLIFQGLLRANSDFASVALCQVDDEQWRELVRVERHSTDYSSVRATPASRLSSGVLTPCMRPALDLDPDEVHLALSSECATRSEKTRARQATATMLSAGVPVFDEESEELFGFVRVETSLDRLIETEMRDRLRSTRDLIVLDNDCRIVLHLSKDRGRNRTSDGRAMTDFVSDWPEIRTSLKTTSEYYDNNRYEIYATKVDLIPGRYSLAIVQSVGEYLTARGTDAPACRL